MTEMETSSLAQAPRRGVTRRRDRGAVMVEFALISFALFALIFGIIEGAFAVRARSAVTNATDDAARKGAVAATSADADFLILRNLIGRGADDAASIQYVVVYNATNASDTINPSCKNGVAVSLVCNVYYPDAFEAAVGQFDCTDTALDGNWCPLNRTPPDDQIGYLGVYVKAEYEPIVGSVLFDTSFTVTADSLQAIETSGES